MPMACGWPNVAWNAKLTGIDHAQPLAVLYDAADARRFRRDRPRTRAVLALTPDAFVGATDLGRPLIRGDSNLGDGGHRRIVARLRHAGRNLDAALAAEPGLGLAARETARHILHLVAATAWRAWLEIGTDGPWLVAGQGGWETTADRTAAHRLLLRRLAGAAEAVVGRTEAPPLAALARLLNRLAARRLAGRRAMLITNEGYGLGAFAAKAAEGGIPCVHIRGAAGRWSDHAHALRALYRGNQAAGVPTLVAIPQAKADVLAAAHRALATIDDPVAERGVAAFERLLASEVVMAEALAAEMAALVRTVAPRVFVSYGSRWRDQSALGEAVGTAGVHRLLISHGSHTPQADPFARAEHAVLADGMLVSPLADTTVVQSPHAEPVARALAPALPRIRSRPLMWGHRPLPAAPARSGTRRILHAGTYKLMTRCRPYIYETSWEFIDGLAALACAATAIDNAELVIRIRSAPECGIETLKTLLPSADNVRIRTGGSFLDDLAAADVLVSFSSTTIEEALHARRPVLLWGGSLRYRHLPARSKRPTPQDRAAVYAPERPEDLPGLLDAVLQAHAGKPLTDTELAAHCWPGQAMEPGELLAAASGSPPPPAEPRAAAQ